MPNSESEIGEVYEVKYEKRAQVFHRAAAAFFAIRLRFAGFNAAARASPPFFPFFRSSSGVNCFALARPPFCAVLRFPIRYPMLWYHFCWLSIDMFYPFTV